MQRNDNPFAAASDYSTPLQEADTQRQLTSSAQSEFYHRQTVSLTNPSGSYSSNSCPVAGEYPASGHLSPLEMIDQIDDDERLLQALEGLTLDSNVLDGETDPSAAAKAESASSANDENFEQGEPRAEHGTRSEFIKNVSETLISRVNGEASNIEEAKQLMHQYMLEFCAEYDRCGYSQKPRNSRLKGDAASRSSAQSDNQSATGASTAASRSGTDQKQSQGQMAFDNQILKKGVRVLSKNLQRAADQNRVKDQQLKVMRSILVHQKNQIQSLHGPILPQQQSSLEDKHSQPISPTNQVTGMMDSLHVKAQPDSSMAGDVLLSSPPSHPGESSDPEQAQTSRSILNRSLHLQQMKTLQNFSSLNNDSKPDIF